MPDTDSNSSSGSDASNEETDAASSDASPVVRTALGALRAYLTSASEGEIVPDDEPGPDD